MNRIRVLLGNHPLMVPTAIRRLVEEQVDMEIVGDCRGPINILRETGRTKADAVILVQEGTNEPGLCSQLLAVYPDLAIVSVTDDMDTAFAQQLRSHRQELGSAKGHVFLQFLRTAVKEHVGDRTDEVPFK
jgi:DNA-binding NarL/FixJ family response regulator